MCRKMELSWCERFLRALLTLSYSDGALMASALSKGTFDTVILWMKSQHRVQDRIWNVWDKTFSYLLLPLIPPSFPSSAFLLSPFSPLFLFLHLHAPFFRLWDICLKVEQPPPLVRSRIIGLGLKLQVSEYFLFHIFRLGY